MKVIRLLPTFLVISVLVSLAGCGGVTIASPPSGIRTLEPASTTTQGMPTSTPSAGIISVVATYAPLPDEEGGDQALLEGEISEYHGCLVIKSWYKTVVPVFSSEKVAIESDTGTFSFNGKTYKIGDNIALGGGFMPDFSSSTRSLPVACQIPDSETFVVSQDA